MGLEPLVIDFATIFDPARLIAVLAAVDIRYSEIWVPTAYDHYKEKDYITFQGTESSAGLLPSPSGGYKADPVTVPDLGQKLDPTRYPTGPQILAWALKQGRAVPANLDRHLTLGREIVRHQGLEHVREAIILGDAHRSRVQFRGPEIPEEEFNKPDWGVGLEWRLEPYGACGNEGIGLMLAARAAEGLELFFSHPFFADGVTKANYNYYHRNHAISAAIGRNPDDTRGLVDAFAQTEKARTLLRSPENVSLEDVAFYLDQSERINAIRGILSASDQLRSKKAENTGATVDTGVIVSKFAVTYAVDTFLFGGAPFSSAAVTVYDVAVRWIMARKRHNE